MICSFLLFNWCIHLKITRLPFFCNVTSNLTKLITLRKQRSTIMISEQKHIHSGQSGTKEATRHQLLAMKCVPWCGLLSQSNGAFPCATPALWPERLSADCSWSPWRSKWNHMGQPDSSTWSEEKLTWVVHQAAPGPGDGWSLPWAWPSVYTFKHTKYDHITLAFSYAFMLTSMPGHTLSLTCPCVHTSSILHPLRGFCGCCALRSGQPIRSIYRRASRHANNTKHTNGRETKPQATDIQ